MSMCLTLSWSIGSSERFIAVLLSQRIVVGFSDLCPITFRSVRSHIASLEASKAALYSASHDEAATFFCFWACQEITPDPSV